MIRSKTTQLKLIGKYEITLNNQNIPYLVKSSRRSHSVRLEINPETGLTVVIPNYHNIEKLPELLVARQRWILGKLKDFSKLTFIPQKKELKNGDSIPYLGYALLIEKMPGNSKYNIVKLEQDRLVISLSSKKSNINSVLEQWYRMQAIKLLRDKLDQFCQRWNLKYNRLTIRGQRTLWGSCSRKNNLNFNWKLIMAPEPVIDYVIIHEIAHIREMNHTGKFWKLVGELCPDWREHRRWLKNHGPELMARFRDRDAGN